jgi:hypothetical protein
MSGIRTKIKAILGYILTSGEGRYIGDWVLLGENSALIIELRGLISAGIAFRFRN